MIVVVDPAMASTNTGDMIISEAIRDGFVTPMLDRGHDVERVPLHGPLTRDHRSLLKQASDVVVCGTNLLSDHMRYRRAWTWHPSDIQLARSKVTVCGAGWWQYQRYGIDPPTRRWMHALTSDKPWAVRDLYSARRLQTAGIPAIHTSCPTLWAVKQQVLPGSATRAVVTLTDYSQDLLADARLIQQLTRRFDHLSFWPQGPGDSAYFKALSIPDAQILAPTLAAYHDELAVSGTAYVGLRLHGGIRAMQRGVPTLILSIDNRAKEVSNSVGLVAPSRHSMKDILDLLNTSDTIQLQTPTSDIASWNALWEVAC